MNRVTPIGGNPLNLLLPRPPDTLQDSWRWGTVKNVSPLRVQLDGDTAPLTGTPDSLCTVTVGDRVRVHLYNRRATIIGKNSYPDAWCYGSKGFDKVTLGKNTPRAFTIPASTVPNFVDGYYLTIGRIQFWVKSNNTLLHAEVGTDKSSLAFTSYENNHSWYVLKPTVHVVHVTREDSFMIRASANPAADALARIEWCLIHPD